MPYIKKNDRQGAVWAPENAGELNFAITNLVDWFIRQQGLSYEAINAAIGALECHKMELYRRIAAPYEDRKLEENGEAFYIVEDGLV